MGAGRDSAARVRRLPVSPGATGGRTDRRRVAARRGNGARARRARPGTGAAGRPGRRGGTSPAGSSGSCCWSSAARERAPGVPTKELAVDPQRSPEEVKAVDGEAARLPLAQAGADPERYRHGHPRRQTGGDPRHDVGRYRLRLRRLALRKSGPGRGVPSDEPILDGAGEELA